VYSIVWLRLPAKEDGKSYLIFSRSFQLEQLIKDEDDPDLGRNTLRKTAAILVRTPLHGRLPVPDDFGALALDALVEGYSDENMEEILLACGKDTATMWLWKEKGML
jgi:hypothetical protein